MNWRKLGIVWSPDRSMAWSRSHAGLPTPLLLNEDVIRVFVTCIDDTGRGRPTFVDVSAHDPTRILGKASKPLLDLGRAGTFDDNGVAVTCVVSPEPGTLYMYYAGFELCHHIRYRIFTGLAISTDNGASFARYSETPILDRTDAELYFRCGPFVLHEDNRFRLWYIAGSEWTNVGGKQVPVYDLRYLESSDGIRYGHVGRISMQIADADEHGFGRPWIVRHGSDDYRLFYSIRRRSMGAYRLGYATSTDGLNWHRQDELLGLDVTPGEFDSDAIMYSAVVSIHGRTYCFYNGNGFGQDGFAVAELIP